MDVTIWRRGELEIKKKKKKKKPKSNDILILICYYSFEIIKRIWKLSKIFILVFINCDSMEDSEFWVFTCWLGHYMYDACTVCMFYWINYITEDQKSKSSIQNQIRKLYICCK